MIFFKDCWFIIIPIFISVGLFRFVEPLFDMHIKNLKINIFNPSYRIGDMISFKESRYLPGGKSAHLTKYPNSIAAEYLKRTNDIDNWLVLHDIIKNRKIAKYPNKNDLVIHLRLGDVIDHDTDNFEKIFIFGNKYVFPIFYYQIILKVIKNYHINRIVIVTYFHNSSENTKSKKYIEELSKLISENGYVLGKRINNPPDDDLIYMCNAHYFCSGKGRFSRIITNLVVLNKKIVIRPDPLQNLL